MAGLPRMKPKAQRPGPKRKGGKQPAPAPGEPGMNDQVRAEIVTRLAMFDKPADIHRDLIERGIDVSVQAVQAYNPGMNQGTRRLAQKWVELFHITREGWLKEIAAEPIAHRAYRLRRLGMIHDRALARGALTVAASMLEQAAKEVGNVYTNVAKVTGTVTHAMPDRTPDENRNLLADRLKEAIARLPKPEASAPTKH